MNKVPGSWETIALAELCERLVDGSHNPPPAVESGKPMLSARNINYFSVLFDEYRFISESAFEVENARTQVTPGDVLLTIVGTIGRAAVVAANHPPFALQRSVAVLKPRGISARYLAYALSSPEQQRWLTDNAKGTAQKGVYLKTLGTAEIHVAPLAEQTRIVAKLEELLSDLDAGVAELKAAQKKLAQYRQSLLKAAVEGALTA
ncbi:MAG TPA: restriction endonuclease subunit S, partial [Acidovorax sp.]|nr:restriction endonuclease subunit S [Acidovorax sp.]